MAEIVRRLDADGDLNFFDISLGGVLSYPKMIGTMYEAAGYELADTAPVTAATRKPTIVAGRIRTLAEADRLIADGKAALVGMTRAHIAKPDLVRKSIAGRTAEIRPCIACNQGCLTRLRSPERRLGCTINAHVGVERETTIERAAAPRHVAIVGEFLDWQEGELAWLGVDVRSAHRAGADDLRRLAADVVLLATGATPRRDGVQSASPGLRIGGIDSEQVIPVLDLLRGPERRAVQTAVVVDDVGGRDGIAAAEWLTEREVRVAFVTWHPSLAPSLHLAGIADAAWERLRQRAFAFHPRTVLTSVQPSEVTVEGGGGGGDRRTIAADLVVLASQGEPNLDLARALGGALFPVQVIGDALSPRQLPAAMASAFTVARAL
ncbi:MAG: hypothetical protein EXQ85_03675 [Alphaproteobacteria bacterium]|nr:hypothetical protein [Alphaproteobacteria bacterium]